LVAGLLLAIAGGQLALALVRVVVFAAAGLTAAILVHQFAPAHWDEPLGWFLAGGLVGLLLFRLWTMILTSFTGSLLMVYGLLCVLDRSHQLDALAWAEERSVMLNGACLALTVVGVLAQFLLERRRLRKQRWKQEELRYIKEREREPERGYYPKRRRWLGWGGGYRQAG
jgi:hypothetical protein